MNRRLFVALTLAALTAAPAIAADAPSFTFPSIDGGTLNTADWRGQPVLVVNTASMCGFTGQLEDMQALHDSLGPRGLVVLAVPSNSFDQEYDDAKRVKEFCTIKFGITLPMADITPVKGADAHPFYRWLRDTQGFEPSWNFNKVLLDPNGVVVGTWGSMTKPGARAITDKLAPWLKG
ncbi:glutathione peroxidase [Paracoccus sp. p4-l81]|uniref:glutathione peroxidase n=1 Tax=Paracoccus sp. p4-l81 TaxID=3342806 RepID=UPI0035B9AF86